jgi:hypothetical protein
VIAIVAAIVAAADLAAAEPAVASLEQVAGEAIVDRAGETMVGVSGMSLNIGDRAIAGDGGAAVVQFRSGCQFRLESGKALDIDELGPCCQASALAADPGDPVASFGRITGEAMATSGSRYVPAREGAQLRVGDRTMATENSSAVILFKNGCRYTLGDDEVLEITAGGPCCTPIGLTEKVTPPELPPTVAGLSGVNPNALPVVVGAAVAICALADCGADDGDGAVRRPLSP